MHMALTCAAAESKYIDIVLNFVSFTQYSVIKINGLFSAGMNYFFCNFKILNETKLINVCILIYVLIKNTFILSIV